MSRGSMIIAALSTVVEWYDFTLYLYFATVLARLFFPGGGGLVAALGGFALAYLMRPIGAMAFGHIGDRLGRRPTMLISMALMTACMAATALMPTAAQIGPRAGVLLIALRCVMGFSVGGEYTGVVAYLLEGAPPARRGLVTSLAAAASEVGGLLAVGASALTVGLLPEAAVAGWGWRLPFAFGAVLAGTVLIARSQIDETPEFELQRAAGAIAAKPLRHALRNHRAGILRGFAISALGSITYYVGITYVPVYLAAVAQVPEGRALGLASWAAVAVIVVTPLTGLLADRWGRRPVILALAGIGRTVPNAGAPKRPGFRRDQRHRHIRRLRAMAGPGADGANGLADGARHPDRAGGAGGFALAVGDAGNPPGEVSAAARVATTACRA